MRRFTLRLLVGTLAAGTACAVMTGCQTGTTLTMPWQKPSPPMVVEPTPITPGSTATPYVAPVVDQPGLQLSTEQRFKDVPVPMGVKPDKERTFVYESPNLHVGRMVYTSRAALADLAQFYIREAPTGQWQLQDTIEAEKSIMLLFNKAGSRLTVEVQDLGVAKGRRLIVTLTPDGGSTSGL